MGQNWAVTNYGGEPSRSSATPSELFEHSRRQYVLQHCRNATDTTIKIEELAIAVQRYEAEIRGMDVSDSHYRLIAIDLHHAHLPKLARSGFLDYDPVKALVHYTNKRVKP